MAASEYSLLVARKGAERTLKRFWKTVSLSQNSDGVYSIKLDNRVLKTVKGAPLLLPARKRAVATLIANEWDRQSHTQALKPSALPMTSLASRAIDYLNSAPTRHSLVEGTSKFLDTDTICYHDPNPTPALTSLQEAHWSPLLDWARKHYNVEIHTSPGLLGLPQPQETREKLAQVVKGWDEWRLAAFERAVLSAKSFIIPLSLLDESSPQYLDVEAAARSATVEVDSQIERWGEVEDTHDVDKADIRRRLGSAAMLALDQE
ncbi:ATP12-domain-containing protein [Atractiella rhizophila]|nr:ATP12-domain-containing protein [Atractiella rhizophila]